MRGSHSLSARGARRTKSSKPKGPPIRSQGPTIPQTSSQSIMREDVVFSTVYIIHCAHTYTLVHWIVVVVVVCSKYIIHYTLCTHVHTSALDSRGSSGLLQIIHSTVYTVAPDSSGGGGGLLQMYYTLYILLCNNTHTIIHYTLCTLCSGGGGLLQMA